MELAAVFRAVRVNLAGALLVAALGHAPACIADKLVLAVGDWPPYISSQLQHGGLLTRIVREAFLRSDIEVELRFYPWSRALLVAEMAYLDGTFAWSHKPEREEKFLYSESFGEYGYVLFHLRSTDFGWRDLADLRGYKIGGSIAYNYGEEFLAAEKAGLLRVEWVPSDESNWRKLMAGRIDLFPQDIHVGYAQLAELFPADQVASVRHHPRPLKPLTSLHLLLPKGLAASPRRMRQFNEGLSQLRAEGEIERFLEEFRETGYRMQPRRAPAASRKSVH